MGQEASSASVTELDLVGRARHGDLDAFTALAGARLAAMTRTATAILGDETEAHDAVQEALISIWRELPTLREPERSRACSLPVGLSRKPSSGNGDERQAGPERRGGA